MLKTQPHPTVQSRHALNDRRQGRMMGSVRRSDDVDPPPKKWTGLGGHTLGESWADVAQGRMQAMGIVEALDILEKVSAGVGAGAINPMVNPLGLEAVKEALHWRVVQAIAFAAHRGCYA